MSNSCKIPWETGTDPGRQPVRPVQQHFPRYETGKIVESIHALRGMTITVIVFRHCLYLFDSISLETSLFAKLVDEFFFNWTIFFVLISGYLFQYLSYKYDTRAYWAAKVKNIVIPYVTVSLAVFALLYPETLEALPLISADKDNLVVWGIGMLVTGQHCVQMWYIPMISVIYLMGPLLYRISSRDLTVVAVICLLWTLITYKPAPSNIPLNVLHYLPVYIIGMFLCQKHEAILRLTRENIAVIALFFLAILGVSFHEKFNVLVLNQSGSYLMSIEKIVLFIILFYMLERFRLPAPLQTVFSYLANISLSVYLLHMGIIQTLLPHLGTLPWWETITTSENGLYSTLMNLLFTMVVILLCSAIVACVKLAFSRKSRLLIGA